MSRGATLALHAALLAAASGPALASSRSEIPAPPAFSPPAGQPLLLSRTLRRGLADGKAIVTTRRYRVSFSPTPSGWAIDGELVGAEVEAPPALAAFADIERKRPDDHLFPILLDRGGRIVPRAAPAAPEAGVAAGEGFAAVRSALALAGRKIEASHAGPGVTGAMEDFMRQLQAAAAQSALTRWPETLFLPGGDSREEQRFALPDGGEGLIAVELRNDRAEVIGTMGRAERRIVTTIGTSHRETREEWTLAPL